METHFKSPQFSVNDTQVESPIFGTIPLDFLIIGDTHPCPYLPEKPATEQVFAAFEFSPELYHDFMDYGFRRSGNLFYRPICKECQECRAIRIGIKDFLPSKSQRRIMRKNQDLTVTVGPPQFTEEKLRIFCDYLKFQHNTDQDDSPENFRNYLYVSPILTLEFEYRMGKRIVAVSIADICSRSFSSVYAYYDPEFSERSLGTFSAIWEILFCRARGIPYYYMGFYIQGCPSMRYKERFRPHEILSPECIWKAVDHSRINATAPGLQKHGVLTKSAL
jgi:arginyl-tRNA--protein-N-Asp/Glu arginylyltransferase